jgi:hypothetical protein
MPKPTEDGRQKEGRNDKRHDVEVWSPNRKMVEILMSRKTINVIMLAKKLICVNDKKLDNNRTRDQER